MGGIILFIIIYPNLKNQNNEKAESWSQRHPKLLIILSFVLVLSGAYDLVIKDASRYDFKTEATGEWIDSDRKALIVACLRDAKDTATKYPELTSKYCECSTDKIMGQMGREEYEIRRKKDMAEHLQDIMPYIKDCLTNLRTGIKEEKYNKN